MARRSKYTPETVRKILDAIRVGTTYELSAAFAGITYETFNEWRKAKPEFSEAIKQAEGAALVGWLAKIEQAGNAGSWQAMAWKAERRYPQEYGKTVQEVTGKDGQPLAQALTIRVEYTDAHPAITEAA